LWAESSLNLFIDFQELLNFQTEPFIKNMFAKIYDLIQHVKIVELQKAYFFDNALIGHSLDSGKLEKEICICSIFGNTFSIDFQVAIRIERNITINTNHRIILLKVGNAIEIFL
jgi:hypothetical protein